MKIAISANGNTLNDIVPEEFEKSPYLLIVETDDMSYEVFPNPDPDGLGLEMAEKIVEEDCEALISGTIEKPAFEVLVAAHVTRYYGANTVGKEALDKMEVRKLDFIRVPNGEVWEPHNHSHGNFFN